MSPRTGRPKVDNPKSYGIKVRFDEQTHRELIEYAKKENITKTDVIRRGVEQLLKDKK